MNELHRCALMRFSKKTGQIDTTLTALGSAMLKMWALQNTTRSKVTLVVDLDTRETLSEYIGTYDFPEVHKLDFDYFVSEQIYDELIKGLKS